MNELVNENAVEKYKNNEYEILRQRTGQNKRKLESLDHPNLKPMVEQFISSRLTKSGVRTEISGMYAHMLPDMSNNLKGYKENNNEPMEIAVPWSMFVQKREGETNAQAKARAEELLKTHPELFQTVVVRVPGSGAVASFAASLF